MAAAVQF